MKIALFGGSFDPVHLEHVRMAEAALHALALDKLFVIPSCIAPHKSLGASAGGDARLAMCRIAFSGLEKAEVSGYELETGGTSYSYLTCRAFKERFPAATLYFLVGADMLEDFYHWREPDDILKHATLAVCGRGGALEQNAHERFLARFHTDFIEVGFTGEDVSSTQIRVALAFGKSPRGLDGRVLAFLKEGGLYSHPAIAPALALEKEERREHSYRVAQLAAARARSLKLEEGKVLLAAALHDCGKYVPADSPYLKGFSAPEGVPAPVLHQYTGAYLAEHVFGIEDEDVLDAIRFHTSGKENMTTLGKLIFLSDLLEPSRTFKGVERLRELFERDLDRCLLESLKEQLAYLEAEGKAVYPLTRAAYLWYLEHKDS